MLLACLAYFLALNMDAIYSSETSVNFQRTTRRSVPKMEVFITTTVRTTSYDVTWEWRELHREKLHNLCYSPNSVSPIDRGSAYLRKQGFVLLIGTNWVGFHLKTETTSSRWNVVLQIKAWRWILFKNTTYIFWRIEPLPSKDLKKIDEYSRCCAIGKQTNRRFWATAR
jgi:hypothetical protein